MLPASHAVQTGLAPTLTVRSEWLRTDLRKSRPLRGKRTKLSCATAMIDLPIEMNLDSIFADLTMVLSLVDDPSLIIDTF